MQKRTFLWRADWVRMLDKKEARDLWQVMDPADEELL